MKLYSLPVSLYGHKVALALKLKGVEIETVAPPGGSYRSAEYRLINPAGTIPCLVDGDLALAESEAILEYLDDLGLGTSLRPDDPRTAARARMLSRWHDMRLEPAVRSLFGAVSPATRDRAAVEAADERIAAAFAIIDRGVEREGPFAAGRAASGADCGFAATATWLEALRTPLGLTAAPGPMLARALAATAAHPLLAAEIADYRARVDAWVAAKIGG